jgi:hypothetical protein
MALFELDFLAEAKSQLDRLAANRAQTKRLKAVRKALAQLQANPRHPGLHTHKFQSLMGPNGEEIFEAYAENRTPAAFRILWCYTGHRKITVVSILPHP